MSAFILLCGLVAASVISPSPAMAHHNAHWSRDKHASLTGTIISAYIGYPHSHVELDCGSDIWSLDIGQPWHIREIHLPVSALVPGVRLRVYGNTTETGGDHRLKVTKMDLNQTSYSF